MKRIIFSFSLLLLTYSVFGQGGESVWKTLSKVDYKITEDEYGELYVPVFSEKVKKLGEQTVSLTGYIIPSGGLDGVFEPEHFILSSLPVSACFFCGVGGPETVMEVYMAEPIEYTDEPIRLEGKLVLNDYDNYQLMYILEEAKYEGPAN